MTVTITPAEYAATVEKIAKINARAEKKGFTGRITLDAVEVVKTREIAPGFTSSERAFEVSLGGEAPAYNGWALLAVLDFDQHAGLVTRMAPGTDDVAVDRDALEAGRCDHCSVTRNRTKSYLVRNVETGEQKQVGSTCIKDFLGWSGTIAFVSVDEVSDEMAGGWGNGGPSDYATDTLLAAAWAAIRAYGFVRSGDWSARSTADTVRVFLNGGKDKEAQQVKADLAPFFEASYAAAAKTRAFVLSEDFSGTSEYVINLKAVAAAEYVSDRNVGLLASAPQALARFEEKTLVREKEAQKPSSHFGTVGDKIEFTGTISGVRYIESAYGTSVLYTIRDEETGNVVKWFASREALGGPDKVGTEVKVKGTIKKHEEFNGLKSTVLTRCKAL
jgi:hypothetical protein